MRLEPKAIPGYEGLYYLDPEIMRVVSIRSGRPLAIRYDGSGYPEVHLSKDGRDEYKRLHRLFAEAYIPNPDNLPFINHKDEDRTNFSLDNLEWCTASYNRNYGTFNERMGPKISKALKGRKYDWRTGPIGKAVIATDYNGDERLFSSVREACEFLDLSTSKVYDVLCGIRNTIHGYSFRYAD